MVGRACAGDPDQHDDDEDEKDEDDEREPFPHPRETQSVHSAQHSPASLNRCRSTCCAAKLAIPKSQFAGLLLEPTRGFEPRTPSLRDIKTDESCGQERPLLGTIVPQIG